MAGRGQTYNLGTWIEVRNTNIIYSAWQGFCFKWPNWAIIFNTEIINANNKIVPSSSVLMCWNPWQKLEALYSYRVPMVQLWHSQCNASFLDHCATIQAISHTLSCPDVYNMFWWHLAVTNWRMSPSMARARKWNLSNCYNDNYTYWQICWCSSWCV